ncbi:MAG: magnesium transporter [Pseudomonadota bacterium]
MSDTMDAPRTSDPVDLVTGELIKSIEHALEARDTDALKELIEGFQAADLADLLAALGPDNRIELITALGDDFNFDAFPELDETVRDKLNEALPNSFLAKAITALESDDAAYVLDGLEDEDRADVLKQVPISDRAALLRNFEYPEETAGRIMQSDFVAVAPYWTVGQVIDHARDSDDLPETFSEIYVVDPTFKVRGAVNLSRLLRTKRDVLISDLMDAEIKQIQANDDQEEVARQFNRYDLLAAPVVDDNERLLGVITVDDMVEVIQEEADEDIKRLAGVGDEGLQDTVLYAARNRFIWLLINLFTAILASAVIKLFDASIEQMVALAVLMPIVASMGGNAGTQTMTVAVRALGTRDLGPVNTMRVVIREAAVGLINGFLFAVILGAITIIWFGNSQLGLVIATAMVFNHFAAALAGILIPIGLEKMGHDPAIASGVFLTTVTDIVGFFAFLGLATLVLL